MCITKNEEFLIDFNDERVQFFYTLAFKDATLRGAYADRDSLQDLKKDLLASMQAYADGIQKEQKHPWENVDAFISAVYQANRGKYNKFSYGNAQKAVNMFLKYLYGATIFAPQLKEEFKNCHCPVDSVIIDKLIELIDGNQKPNLRKEYDDLEEQGVLEIARYKKNTKKAKKGDFHLNSVGRKHFENIVWSGMDKGEYQAIRNLLLALGKDDSCTQLELDYKYWSSAAATEEDSE